MVKIDFRAIDKDDEELIWKIVYVTADMGKTGETIEEAKKNADRRRYVCEWGKPLDYGIIGETPVPGKELVGAAWLRLLKFENKGAGYVDDQTPELSIGIFKGYRNGGIGKKMMIKLIDDVPLRNKYGKNGRKLVLEKFSSEIVDNATLEVYTD